MENQIEKILQSYFNENVHISVSFIDFNEYTIICNVLGKYGFEFNASIDNRYSLKSNCISIIERIELFIINIFKEV